MVATFDQFLVPTAIPVPDLTPTRLDVQLVELILKRNGKKIYKGTFKSIFLYLDFDRVNP